MQATDALGARLDRAADLVTRSGRVVVFTGAGVSTESGIPDFRSPTGLWARYDPDDFSFPNVMRSGSHMGVSLGRVSQQVTGQLLQASFSMR